MLKTTWFKWLMVVFSCCIKKPCIERFDLYGTSQCNFSFTTKSGVGLNFRRSRMHFDKQIYAATFKKCLNWFLKTYWAHISISPRTLYIPLTSCVSSSLQSRKCNLSRYFLRLPYRPKKEIIIAVQPSESRRMRTNSDKILPVEDPQHQLT